MFAAKRSSSTSSSRPQRLDRRNANKHIDYDASTSFDDSPALRSSRSLDLPAAYSSQKSFRIEGYDGEVDQLYRELGLSGPDDFAIPAAAWAARKVRSLNSAEQSSGGLIVVDEEKDTPPPMASSGEIIDDGIKDSVIVPLPFMSVLASETRESAGGLVRSFAPEAELGDEGVAKRVYFDFEEEEEVVEEEEEEEGMGSGSLEVRLGESIGDLTGSSLASPSSSHENSREIADDGIKRLTLPPPPFRSVLASEMSESAWDLVRSFAAEAELGDGGVVKRSHFDSEEEEEEEEEEQEEEVEEEERGIGGGEVRLGETIRDLAESSSVSTLNSYDPSRTTEAKMFVVSPNGRFKRNITSWMRGHRLGSGSFGTVFEGMSNDGFFFAVKEVSLLDQGNNAKQCILQLEQEIALLSQFEHDNIVQYVGTDKEEAKLYIFLELATQGSLASLYQKYHLQDSQVSAYTRQILNGLRYLHDRNVVHRDIKCANILVDSHGTVKLADFGLAKEITKLDVLKSCKGSAYWMAPEVVNPKRAYGPAADIWSLGCTVLEMLTRQVPYPNLEWAQAFFKIGQGEPPPLPNTLSLDARDFIQRCVQVNPYHRPTASQLSEHQFVRRSLSTSTSPNNSFHDGNRYG
ncbi:Mitogen-activated protein kinase kinase kinase protein [Dioscorea alata]|uniref:Mitogen-activated protein kinase kinase kinase protein n=2 Tax=Dioscorea alata TaxID=55571 RepID=A0ACB7VXP9_DIOAL|nr:Mitogen-activated protein kinase kinase kinase protein [Dioscorea alata]KAH7679481.1 Mitogen-activated protein kinase kinase kinase protein [Dioscorea alata]